MENPETHQTHRTRNVYEIQIGTDVLDLDHEIFR